MDFTLKQIRTFLTVIEQGSTKAAAKELNISQPAVSSAISELENNLGINLFDRWKKRMILNDRGRALIPKARGLITQAQELEQSFSREKGEIKGTIRLGASRTLAGFVIPDVLADFIETYPGVRFEVVSFNKREIISRVEDFSLDLGVIAGTCNKQEVQNIPWLTDELSIFCGASHPLAGKSKITVNDLAVSHWVLREEGSGTLEVFLESLPPGIKPLKTIMEFNNLEPIKRFVEKGTALGCISSAALEREVEAGILTILPTPFLTLKREYYFLVHQQKRQSSLLNEFLVHCLTR